MVFTHTKEIVIEDLRIYMDIQFGKFFVQLIDLFLHGQI